jgi:L-rhamnose mutarotase
METLKNGYLREPYPFATKRYCQLLKLKPNGEKTEQYKYWHNSKNIWKEIPEGIRRAGILDMEIYFLADTVVMILDTPAYFDWDEAFGRLATYERQAEWETFVSQFQDAEPGQKSDEKWTLAERIFSLEEALAEGKNK